MDVEASLRQLKAWKNEGLIDAATHAEQCRKLLECQTPAWAVSGARSTAQTAGESKSADFQAPTWEDPATLPFELPGGLDDVTAEWMTKVLTHRGILTGGVVVSSIVKKGVGMTAGYFSSIAKVACTYSGPAPNAPVNYVVKAWPPFEILPKEAIGNMFLNDIKGYCFPAADFYPRPDCFLASWDVEKNLYALVLADADETGEHKIHENELTFDEVAAMIPKMAKMAATFENCHSPQHRLHEQAAYMPFWAQKGNLGIYHPTTFQNGMKPFDKFAKFGLAGEWQNKDMDGYSALFDKKYWDFFARAHPDAGASVTLSHGDFRGDNIFFRHGADGKPDPKMWQVIDFQLTFKGPIPSDLAYLMTSGSVLPGVYGDRCGEIRRLFYDEFQKHTTAYKAAAGYTFEKFEKEFFMMAHVLYIYYVSMGAAIWMSGEADGKLDPSQPDVVVGPVGASPELGSGSVKVEDLSPEDIRKRMWWGKSFKNFLRVFKDGGGKEFLETMKDTGPAAAEKEG